MVAPKLKKISRRKGESVQHKTPLVTHLSAYPPTHLGALTALQVPDPRAIMDRGGANHRAERQARVGHQ